MEMWYDQRDRISAVERANSFEEFDLRLYRSSVIGGILEIAVPPRENMWNWTCTVLESLSP